MLVQLGPMAALRHSEKGETRMKKSFIVSLAVLLIGIIYGVIYALQWMIFKNFFGFLALVFLNLGLIALPILMIIGSVVFITKYWSSEKFFSLIPILSVFISIYLCFSILTSLVDKSQITFFKVNYNKYVQAAEYLEKLSIQSKMDWNELPRGYKYLTENGQALILIEDSDINILFFFRRGIGNGEYMLYSPSKRILVDKRYDFIVNEEKPNWFYAVVID